MNNLAQALSKDDAAGAASLFAEDGVLMPPNEPLVKGRAAIEAYFKKNVDRVGNVSYASLASSVEGAIGVSFGTFTDTTGNPAGMLTLGVGGGSQRNGKYGARLTRTGGAWVLTHLIFNHDAAKP